MVFRPEKRREKEGVSFTVWLFECWRLMIVWLTLVAVLARTLYCSSRRRRSSSLGILKRVMRSMGAILVVEGGVWRVDEVVDINLEVNVKLRGGMRRVFSRPRSIGGCITGHFIFLPEFGGVISCGVTADRRGADGGLRAGPDNYYYLVGLLFYCEILPTDRIRMVL